MDEVLEILEKDGRLSAQEIAKMVHKSADTIKKAIKKYEKEPPILKYKAVINKDLKQIF